MDFLSKQIIFSDTPETVKNVYEQNIGENTRPRI